MENKNIRFLKLNIPLGTVIIEKLQNKMKNKKILSPNDRLKLYGYVLINRPKRDFGRNLIGFDYGDFVLLIASFFPRIYKSAAKPLKLEEFEKLYSKIYVLPEYVNANHPFVISEFLLRQWIKDLECVIQVNERLKRLNHGKGRFKARTPKIAYNNKQLQYLRNYFFNPKNKKWQT